MIQNPYNTKSCNNNSNPNNSSIKFIQYSMLRKLDQLGTCASKGFPLVNHKLNSE